MKRIEALKSVIGLGSILALTVGLSTSMVAGPSPQFWAKQTATAADRTDGVKHVVTGKSAAKGPPMACAGCKTRIYAEQGAFNAANRATPRATKVGKRHYCESCKGFVTSIPGEAVSDQMLRSHAQCATGACCKV